MDVVYKELDCCTTAQVGWQAACSVNQAGSLLLCCRR